MVVPGTLVQGLFPQPRRVEKQRPTLRRHEALKTCDSMSQAKKKCEEQLRDDDKVPMDPILNQSLIEAWNKLYHVPLPSSQELTSQILNRMYRELKSRSGEAKPIQGLYTKESILSIGQEERERQQEGHPRQTST